MLTGLTCCCPVINLCSSPVQWVWVKRHWSRYITESFRFCLFCADHLKFRLSCIVMTLSWKQPKFWISIFDHSWPLSLLLTLFNSIQFNSSCPTLTPKVTSGRKLLQCRECVFKQKRYQFMLENVRVWYFLNCMGQALPSFTPSMEKTAPKLQPSCLWFITVSPGRSETDSGSDICDSSNKIRQIRHNT